MSEQPASNKHTIVKEKGFYDTIWAKLLSVFFLFMTIGIMVLMLVTDSFEGTKLWRLFVILIPGTLYMLGRSFGKKS